MLRMIQSTSSAGAKSYYTHGLSREDYYSEGQEIVGAWGGRLAEKLGLSGQVDKAAFDALCDNLNPATGERLTARTNDGRRVGYDFNFHCPKSVSVLYALSGDENILMAFRDSVRETMQDLEQSVQARVRAGGKNENRDTANIAYGEFVHFTARPVSGVPDPHLHAHCFVFNATFDAAENKIKAGDFAAIKRDASYYEAGFHARLAGKLAALGYGIEKTAKGWEISGVSRPVIDKFSRRTATIEKLAREKGISTAKGKDALGAKTRENKRDGLTMDDLKAEWQSWLSDAESDALRQAKDLPQKAPLWADAAAVDYALKHSFERQSVISEKQLMTEALKHGVGFVSVEGVKKEALRAEILSREIDGRKFTTTKDVLQEEKAMIAAAASRRGRCARLSGKAPALSADLSDEQKNAVRHVLSSRDGVIAIRGAAGVGKTRLMRETARHIEQGGKQVFAFAPTAQASRGVLYDEGFKNADTLASLLSDKNKQDAIKNNVVWIDEAGQVGAKTMRQVLELAEKQNARVILTGDIRQHSSVERGDALRILEDNGGVKVATVAGIRRQEGAAYRNAIQDLSKGDAAAGFDKLDALGAIVETADAGERYAALARDYAETIKSGKTALIVSPTHSEGEKVTSAVRSELKSIGKLGETEKHITRLSSLSWTEAERADGRNYAPGLVVQFQQKVKGFERGERVAVLSRSENGAVIVGKADGQTVALPLAQASRFSVYSAETLAVAPGDKLRITQNGFTAGANQKNAKRLNNGALYEVAGFDRRGNIELTNGWTVPKNYGHLAHGYCVTSHASQGVSVKRIFIAQSSASLAASSKEQFYVSASRGRESVKIYTDDKTALREAVGASAVRLSALELVGQSKADKAKKSDMVKARAMQLNRLASLARAYASRSVAKVKEKSKEWTARVARVNDPRKERGFDYER
jgi:conjugative relaxase-like TrwC/TraI family protein